jgi:malate permease and related proteins
VLHALANVVFPVLLVVGVGALLGKYQRIDPSNLSRLALYALVPCLAFSTLLTTSVRPLDFLQIAFCYLLTTGCLALIAWLIARKLETSKRSFIVSVILGNNGNFGLPMAFFALGQSGLEISLMVFLVSVLVTFIGGPAILSSHGNFKQSLLTVAKLPLVWFALLGWSLNLLHVRLPGFIMEGIQLLAQATVPTLLLSLGLQLGKSGWRLPQRAVWWAVVLRFLGTPLLTYFLTGLLGIHGLTREVLMLASTMPTAINAFLLTSELGGDVQMVVDTVMVTTLLCIPAITLMVTLLPYIH